MKMNILMKKIFFIMWMLLKMYSFYEFIIQRKTVHEVEMSNSMLLNTFKNEKMFGCNLKIGECYFFKVFILYYN